MKSRLKINAKLEGYRMKEKGHWARFLAVPLSHCSLLSSPIIPGLLPG